MEFNVLRVSTLQHLNSAFRENCRPSSEDVLRGVIHTIMVTIIK